MGMHSGSDTDFRAWPTGELLGPSGVQGTTFAKILRVVTKFAIQRASFWIPVEDAKEIGQDIGERLFREACTKDSPRAGRAPTQGDVRRMVLGHLSNYWKRRRTRRAFEHRLTVQLRDAAVEPPEIPESLFGESAVARALEAILRKMPHKRRAAWVLARAQGYSYEQVAALIGSTVNGVRQHVVAANKAIEAAKESGQLPATPEQFRKQLGGEES